ncbi:MAG: GNAT family N-acetyltransferase [Anaerolineales bacterium]|nr:GNAT family N-acetyltransferase [Anaerolineales bacterium]
MHYFGEKIRLRAIERDDLPRYVAWFADSAVSENLSSQMPMSLAHEERWYEENLKQPPDQQALAVDLDRGRGKWEHVGGTGFHVVDQRNRFAECGLFIGVKKYWGKGYGRDILRTLLRFGFETLNLNRIQLRVMEYNRRAIRLYEKSGFVREGSMREAHFYRGRYWDMHLYSILRREWQALPGNPKE